MTLQEAKMTEKSASSAAKQQSYLLRSALSESALAPKPGFWEGKTSGPLLRLQRECCRIVRMPCEKCCDFLFI